MFNPFVPLVRDAITDAYLGIALDFGVHHGRQPQRFLRPTPFVQAIDALEFKIHRAGTVPVCEAVAYTLCSLTATERVA